MSRSRTRTSFHAELEERLRYFDGHSDTLGLFADAAFLRRTGSELAAPFREGRGTKVVGIEARGFVLATAVALELGAGFAAVRKAGAIHPGPKEELLAPTNWRGQATLLRLQRHAVTARDRVLIVDDWAESGSSALTARELVARSGGHYVGLSLLVDQLRDDVRAELEPVAAVALASEAEPASESSVR